MIKAFLFDLDGTLINTNDIILASYKHVLQKRIGRELRDEEITIYFGEPLDYTMKNFTDDNMDELIAEYREYNLSIHDEEVKPYERINETLEKMKELGYKLAIVTSKNRSTAMRGMKLFGIDEYMDVIITPEDTEKHKPQPEPVLKACEILGIDPSEAVMVGDSHNDILSGQKAGSRTCALTYTAIPFDRISKLNPTYTVEHIEELIELVEEKQVG